MTQPPPRGRDKLAELNRQLVADDHLLATLLRRCEEAARNQDDRFLELHDELDVVWHKSQAKVAELEWQEQVVGSFTPVQKLKRDRRRYTWYLESLRKRLPWFKENAKRSGDPGGWADQMEKSISAYELRLDRIDAELLSWGEQP